MKFSKKRRTMRPKRMKKQTKRRRNKMRGGARGQYRTGVIVVNNHSNEQYRIADVDGNTSVYDLKEAIQYQTGIPNYQQSLQYNGDQLYDNDTLSDYNIRGNNERISMAFLLQRR